VVAAAFLPLEIRDYNLRSLLELTNSGASGHTSSFQCHGRKFEIRTLVSGTQYFTHNNK
jgi:hypothetical protein